MMLEIVEKAYKVYHNGMIGENTNEYYSFDTLPVIYAESSGKAKTKCGYEPYDYKLNGNDIEYTDLKAVRWKEYDKIRFENKVIVRYYMDEILKERKLVQDRTKKLNKFPDDSLFYVSTGKFVGNYPIFWALNDCGYTCQIENVQTYTKSDIIKDHIKYSERRIWHSSEIMRKVVKVVESQGLNYDYCL
jgi:hypothetical protein